jgi:hypothetical protein
VRKALFSRPSLPFAQPALAAGCQPPSFEARRPKEGRASPSLWLFFFVCGCFLRPLVGAPCTSIPFRQGPALSLFNKREGTLLSNEGRPPAPRKIWGRLRRNGAPVFFTMFPLFFSDPDAAAGPELGPLFFLRSSPPPPPRRPLPSSPVPSLWNGTGLARESGPDS